jgi:hypothetical protein
MNPIFRKTAEPIAQEITDKILYHLRYKMSVWPKQDDSLDMKRIIKSIIVQNMENKDDSSK